jgi:hypothetical protein
LALLSIASFFCFHYVKCFSFYYDDDLIYYLKLILCNEFDYLSIYPSSSDSSESELLEYFFFFFLGYLTSPDSAELLLLLLLLLLFLPDFFYKYPYYNWFNNYLLLISQLGDYLRESFLSDLFWKSCEF